jgi:hypothetical protein
MPRLTNHYGREIRSNHFLFQSIFKTMSSKENFIGTNPFSLHCHIYFIQNLEYKPFIALDGDGFRNS